MFEVEDFIVEEVVMDELETNFFNSIRNAMKQIAETAPKPVQIRQKKGKKKSKMSCHK